MGFLEAIADKIFSKTRNGSKPTVVESLPTPLLVVTLVL
jgi:hypothetical protein